MIDESLVRAALLLGPGVLLAALWLALRPSPRAMTAAALALLWNIPFVLLVNVLAFRLGWWSFAPGERSLLGMPVDVLLGWAVFWGPVAALALFRLSLLIVLLGFAWIDVVLMPQLAPLVKLGDHWLIGEVVALALCLLPGQILARDTQARQNVGRRAALQGIGYGAWLIFLIPAALAQHAGVDYIAAIAGLGLASWVIYPLGLFLLIGLAALHEFAAVGGGTPIPFDPPQRLVTTGPYAYLANPMQTVSIAVMLLLAAWLAMWELALMAASFFVYAVGFVRWHHDADIAKHFGPEWSAYRAAVPNWWPRWRPYVREPATLHVDESCLRCRRFADRIIRLHPVGLSIAVGTGKVASFIYRHPDGHTENGVVALARALEHTNLALACIGWFMRLPGLVEGCVFRNPQKRITFVK